MGKKRSKTGRTAVTTERAARLYKLVKFLGAGSKTRSAILRRLRVDIRTFYRDLELLRECDIQVQLENKRYLLNGTLKRAEPLLPFPDPTLTLGEAQSLAKGRTKTHRKMKQFLGQIMK